MGVCFPEKQSSCCQGTVIPCTPLRCLVEQRPDVLGPAPCIMRSCELPGRGGALGWALSVAFSRPCTPGFFLPFLPPWTVSCQPLLVDQGSLSSPVAALRPVDHVRQRVSWAPQGRLCASTHGFRLSPRGVECVLSGRASGGSSPPLGGQAAWLRDELFPSLWVFSRREGTEESRGHC